MKILAWIQGIYFLVTALWPFVHLESFLAVTGPKKEIWLLKTVSVLIAAIGATLIFAAATVGDEKLAPPIVFLAVSSAAGLAAIDVVYVWQRTIRRVYLADAFAEFALIAAWTGAVIL